MFSFKSILMGTIFTVLALGLLYVAFNYAAVHTMGKTAVEIVNTLDTTREMVHQNTMNLNKFVSFITSKIFFQTIILLALLCIWLTNINWIENRWGNDVNAA